MLSVVFITMLINVLKVFDIIIAIAPGSVQDDASVLALAMWRTSFGGVNDFGRAGDRRVHFPARDPHPAPERQALPERAMTNAVDVVSTPGQAVDVVDERDTFARRVVRFLGRAPVTIFLVVVGVLWLAPTLGPLFTSLLAPEDFQTKAGGRSSPALRT